MKKEFAWKRNKKARLAGKKPRMKTIDVEKIAGSLGYQKLMRLSRAAAKAKNPGKANLLQKAVTEKHQSIINN